VRVICEWMTLSNERMAQKIFDFLDGSASLDGSVALRLDGSSALPTDGSKNL